MKRIALTDGSGRWFNEEKAESWNESTWWDGSNHVSHVTGSQWEHERLYRTASGRWVLNSWSQWQGSKECYEAIDDDAAAKWLVQNDHEPHRVVAEQFAALEM